MKFLLGTTLSLFGATLSWGIAGYIAWGLLCFTYALAIIGGLVFRRWYA